MYNLGLLYMGQYEATELCFNQVTHTEDHDITWDANTKLVEIYTKTSRFEEAFLLVYQYREAISFKSVIDALNQLTYPISKQHQDKI